MNRKEGINYCTTEYIPGLVKYVLDHPFHRKWPVPRGSGHIEKGKSDFEVLCIVSPTQIKWANNTWRGAVTKRNELLDKEPDVPLAIIPLRNVYAIAFQRGFDKGYTAGILAYDDNVNDLLEGELNEQTNSVFGA